MDWFDFDQEAINQAQDWISQNAITINERKIEFPNGMYIVIKEDEPLEELLETEKFIQTIVLLSAIIEYFPLFVMKFYFHNASDDFDDIKEMHKYMNIINMIMSNITHIYHR